MKAFHFPQSVFPECYSDGDIHKNPGVGLAGLAKPLRQFPNALHSFPQMHCHLNSLIPFPIYHYLSISYWASFDPQWLSGRRTLSGSRWLNTWLLVIDPVDILRAVRLKINARMLSLLNIHAKVTRFQPETSVYIWVPHLQNINSIWLSPPPSLPSVDMWADSWRLILSALMPTLGLSPIVGPVISTLGLMLQGFQHEWSY